MRPQGGGRRFPLIKKQQIQTKNRSGSFFFFLKGTLMVARGCIFHMPSEGDLYRCTSWFGSCSSPCIAPGELDRAQLLVVGSSSPMHGGGTGAELVGNAGMEKTLPAGKAMKRGRSQCQADFRALPGRRVGMQQGLARGKAGLQGGQNAVQIPACRPASAWHSCATLRTPLPARSGTGDR